MIICAPMVVTSALGICRELRHLKTRKWKLSRTMSLNCTQFLVGRSVIVLRLARLSAVMMKRGYWMIKMTGLTVIASVARFVQENQMVPLAAGSEIVILNPQQARAVLEVLIGTANAPPRRRKGPRKLLR